MKKVFTAFAILCFCQNSISQNVGIGTTSPLAKLHVISSSGNPVVIDGGSPMYVTLSEGGTARAYIGSYSGNAEDVDFGTFGSNITGKIHLTTGNVPRLTVINSGNVGIGTTNPEQLFSVAGGMVIDQTDLNNGTATTMLRFGSSSGEGIGSRRTAGTNQYGIDFYTQSANRMTITNGGNVGIGLINPSSKLEVRGALGFSSTTKRWEMNYDSTNGYFYIDEFGANRRFFIKDGGNVGIGQSNPVVPLQFANNGGNKISFFQNGSNHYGIGTQSSLLQFFAPTSADDIAFGYGNSNSFNEVMRVKGNRTIELKNSSGTPTITLDGTSGTITSGKVFANNLSAYGEKVDSLLNYFIEGYENHNLVMIDAVITLPSNGYLLLWGNAKTNFLDASCNPPSCPTGTPEFKLDEYTVGNTYLSTLYKNNLYLQSDFRIVKQITNSGQYRFKYKFFVQNSSQRGLIRYPIIQFQFFPNTLTVQ